MTARLFNPEKGTWVLLSFIAFFGLIVVVNGVFITTALSTHSGVITDRPYEKGLAYDDMLKEAYAQPAIQQKAVFENNVLRWTLSDETGRPLDANVKARLVRPTDDNHDFEIILKKTGDGVYETSLNLPMRGRWEAQLKAQWNNAQYQTRFSFMAK